MSSTFVRIGRFVLDVALTENHTFEAEVTDYPVESGGSVTDNIRPKPIKVTIEGVVSDTPLKSNAYNKPVVFSDPFTTTGGTTANDTITAAASAGFVLEPNANDTNNTAASVVKFLRSEEALNYLKQIWASRDTVTIRTSLGTFDNMAMSSLTIPRSKETTGGLKFTADFQQVQRVVNGRVRKAIRNGNGKRNRGPQGTQDWYIRETIWRKAFPAGSANIEETYQVKWYWKPKGIEAHGPTTTAGLAALGVDVTPVSAGLGNTAKWYYWSGPRGLPNPIALTDYEVRWLIRDLDRDQKARTQPGGVAALASGDVARATDAVAKSLDPKRGAADLSKKRAELVRRDQFLTQPPAGGVPKLNNSGNFQSDKPWEDQKTLESVSNYKGLPTGWGGG